MSNERRVRGQMRASDYQPRQTQPNPKRAESAADRLFMLLLGGEGPAKSQAHEFVRECGLRPMRGIDSIKYDVDDRMRRVSVRFFIPPHADCRVVMFPDKSGAYIHADGLVTVLDSDISGEIHNYTETTE
jgi:hypothetical protein